MGEVLATGDGIGTARETWMSRVVGDLRSSVRSRAVDRPMATASEYAAAGRADLVVTAAGRAAALLERWTTVGVTAPDGNTVEALRAALPLESNVDVLTPTEAKGLEFDAAVVVEPGLSCVTP